MKKSDRSEEPSISIPQPTLFFKELEAAYQDSAGEGLKVSKEIEFTLKDGLNDETW